MQGCSVSRALSIEIVQSCTRPSIYYVIYAHDFLCYVILWSNVGPWLVWVVLMKSSNGNIFRFICPLWGEPPVTGGYSSQGPVAFSLIWASTNSWANRDADDLRRHRAYYDVVVTTVVVVGLFLCHWGNSDSHASTTPQLRNEANIECTF